MFSLLVNLIRAYQRCWIVVDYNVMFYILCKIIMLIAFTHLKVVIFLFLISSNLIDILYLIQFN